MTRRQPEVCSEGSSPNQRLKLTGAAVLVSVVQRFSRRPRQFSLAVGLGPVDINGGKLLKSRKIAFVRGRFPLSS
jgi:hypothetical protein